MIALFPFLSYGWSSRKPHKTQAWCQVLHDFPCCNVCSGCTALCRPAKATFKNPDTPSAVSPAAFRARVLDEDYFLVKSDNVVAILRKLVGKVTGASRHFVCRVRTDRRHEENLWLLLLQHKNTWVILFITFFLCDHSAPPLDMTCVLHLISDSCGAWAVFFIFSPHFLHLGSTVSALISFSNHRRLRGKDFWLVCFVPANTREWGWESNNPGGS